MTRTFYIKDLNNSDMKTFNKFINAFTISYIKTFNKNKNAFTISDITFFFLIIFLSILLSTNISYCMENGADGGNAQTLLEWLLQTINTSTASIQDNIQNGVQTSITSFFTMFGLIFSWFKNWFFIPIPESYTIYSKSLERITSLRFKTTLGGLQYQEFFNSINMFVTDNYVIYSNTRFKTILGVQHQEFLNMINIFLPENSQKFSRLLTNVNPYNIVNVADFVTNHVSIFNFNINVPFRVYFDKIENLFISTQEVIGGLTLNTEFFKTWIYTDSFNLYGNIRHMDDFVNSFYEDTEYSARMQDRSVDDYLITAMVNLYLEYIAHFFITGSFTEINPNVVEFVSSVIYNDIDLKVFDNIISLHVSNEMTLDEFNDLSQWDKFDVLKHISITEIPALYTT